MKVFIKIILGALCTLVFPIWAEELMSPQCLPRGIGKSDLYTTSIVSSDGKKTLNVSFCLSDPKDPTLKIIVDTREVGFDSYGKPVGKAFEFNEVPYLIKDKNGKKVIDEKNKIEADVSTGENRKMTLRIKKYEDLLTYYFFDDLGKTKYKAFNMYINHEVINQADHYVYEDSTKPKK